MRQLESAIARLLMIILERSWRSGKVSEDCKKAMSCPVFKKVASLKGPTVTAVGDQQLPIASSVSSVKPPVTVPVCWLQRGHLVNWDHIRYSELPFLHQLGGCGILGVGIWLAVTQGNFATLSSSFPSLSAANLLIVTGTFVMIIGFVGCIGAIKENKCLLLSFFIMLLIIFLLELTVVILFFVYTDKDIN
ncbi:tetraspanin-4 isoform X8 [Aphelocoma coerulescens]|uniref:tetraspanin-4 isoform X8 n=1 Tax=Aphelocoma coerulescens TaxID=39617 RepID=UPI003604C80F